LLHDGFAGVILRISFFNPLMGLMADARLTEEYHLNFYVRRRWLDRSIQASPVVDQKFLDTAFVALSYRFK